MELMHERCPHRGAPLGFSRLRKGAGMSEFLERVEWWIQAWHAISAPNEQAKRAAARLSDMIHKAESLRGTLRFGDEPSSFEAALIQAKGKPDE